MPGLVVAGAGLAVLVIPLVNVVLAAVPAEVAGGASGLFGTARQLGGALGVAVFGTVFFGYLTGHWFEAALVHTAPWAMGAFALCAVLAMLLLPPGTAVWRKHCSSPDGTNHGPFGRNKKFTCQN